MFQSKRMYKGEICASANYISQNAPCGHNNVRLSTIEILCCLMGQTKKEGKDQESIQSITTPNSRH